MDAQPETKPAPKPKPEKTSMVIKARKPFHVAQTDIIGGDPERMSHALKVDETLEVTVKAGKGFIAGKLADEV